MAAATTTIIVPELSIDASGLLLQIALTPTTLLGGLIINLTASAEVMNKMFQFTSIDASALNLATSSFRTDSSSSNMSSFKISTSCTDPAETGDRCTLESSSVAAGNLTLGNDYFGYIAREIYSNTAAINFFSNGPEVVDSVNTTADNALKAVFVKCFADGSLNYNSNPFSYTSSQLISPSQAIIEGLLKLASTASRFDNVTFSTGNTWNDNKLIPGDSIMFNCTVRPAINQDIRVLTRYYRVKVLLS